MSKAWAASNWVVRGAALLILAAAAPGCQSTHADLRYALSPIPRELEKTALPAYTVEPPDILEIDAIQVVPLPPYRAQALDTLFIQVAGVLPEEPISRLFQIGTDGNLNLGPSYGTVRVLGLTLDQIKEQIEQMLIAKKFKDVQASVTLAQSRILQQVAGPHLVRPDGTVALGMYGSVPVAGLTLPEVKSALEAHMSKYVQKPELSVDVLAYNSKIIYVIFDGGGNGQQIVRLPSTGNDTVLDAVAQVGGLQAISSARRIWVARPGPAVSCEDQILPVDWQAITKNARTATNYQLLPGDRLYVAAQPLVTMDTALTKVINPIERLFGITLLGNGVAQTFHPSNNINNGTNTTP